MGRYVSAVALGGLVLSLAYFGSLHRPAVSIVSPVVTQPAGGAEALAPAFRQLGRASWYRGSRKLFTANGEHFDDRQLTAAHRTLPFDTMLRVTNLVNSRSVVLRVNDRGPYVRGRVIDLTAGAAAMLGMKHDGVVPVLIETITDGETGDEKLADMR